MLISQDAIFLNEDLPTQEATFHFIAQQAVALGVATDEAAVYDGLKAREAQGTTGMMDGFAIPHAKVAAITTPKIVMIKLANPVDWNSLDGTPSSFVISMLIPDSEAGTTHLRLLAQVARMLMKEDVKSALHAATTADEIEAVVKEQLN